MVSCGKAITLVLVALFLTLAFLIPSITNAQTTSSYGRDSGINPAAFTLTMYNPNNQTVYTSTLLLNFNITWTTYPIFDFTFAPPLSGDYAYSIDNNPLVSIASNQSASDLFYASPSNNFKINPSFSYLVNVSNLTNGYHKIVIKASLYSGAYLFFNESSLPTLFLVQNPTSSSTPSSIIGALISPLTLTIIVTVVVLVVIAVSLLLYRRHRKHLP